MADVWGGTFGTPSAWGDSFGSDAEEPVVPVVAGGGGVFYRPWQYLEPEPVNDDEDVLFVHKGPFR